MLGTLFGFLGDVFCNLFFFEVLDVLILEEFFVGIVLPFLVGVPVFVPLTFVPGFPFCFAIGLAPGLATGLAPGLAQKYKSTGDLVRTRDMSCETVPVQDAVL